jgi:hypothetical protein
LTLQSRFDLTTQTKAQGFENPWQIRPKVWQIHLLRLQTLLVVLESWNAAAARLVDMKSFGNLSKRPMQYILTKNESLEKKNGPSVGTLLRSTYKGLKNADLLEIVPACFTEFPSITNGLDDLSLMFRHMRRS